MSSLDQLEVIVLIVEQESLIQLIHLLVPTHVKIQEMDIAMMVEQDLAMVPVISEPIARIVEVDHRVKIPVPMPMMVFVTIMNWVRVVLVTAEPIVRTVVPTKI